MMIRHDHLDSARRYLFRAAGIRGWTHAIVSGALLLASVLSVTPARAADLSAEQLDDLIKLARAELILLTEEIDAAEPRFLARFAGHRTLVNRGPRTADDICAGFGELRRDTANAREQLRDIRARWQRGTLDDEQTLRRLYREVRRSITKVWGLQRSEAGQTVHGLNTEQNDVRKALAKEREAVEVRLRADFGFGSDGYHRGLKRFEEEVHGREETRFSQMRARHDEAAQQLAAGRRRLCREAWRWEDIARRRDHGEEAQRFKEFVYRAFAFRLQDRPLAEREALLGKDRAGGGSTLDTWRDLRKDRLALQGFAGPQVVLRMDQVLAAEKVEEMRDFDDSPLPEVAPDTYRITTLSVDVNPLDAARERLRRELREAQSDYEKTVRDYERAVDEQEQALRAVDLIQDEMRRIQDDRDRALARSHELAGLAETARRRSLLEQKRADEKNLALSVERLDELKEKGALSTREIEERRKLLAEIDSAREHIDTIDTLLSEEPEVRSPERARQDKIAADKQEEYFDATRRLRSAEIDAGVAAALTDGALTQVFTTRERLSTAHKNLVASGVGVKDFVTDVLIVSKDGRKTYFRAQTLSDFRDRLDAIEPQIKAAAARYRRAAEAWNRFDADYQRLVKDRDAAGARLETVVKRSGLSQVAFESLNFYVKARRGAFREGVKDRLTGGWDIVETDLAADSIIGSDDPDLALTLPQGLVESVQSKNWRDSFELELEKFVSSRYSPEEYERRMQDLETVRQWKDTLTLELNGPSVLDSMRNQFPSVRGATKEQIDKFIRLEAVQTFELAQLKLSVTFLLRQKAGVLKRDAYFVLNGLQSVQDRIIGNLDDGTNLVVTVQEDIPRGEVVTILIGHPNVGQSNVAVDLGDNQAAGGDDWVIPVGDSSRPASRFTLTMDNLKHDGSGGVTLEIRFVP
ncbi:MAG: hypothetical protein CV089_01860 [Nitrospira sp. WS110]|nr:hypothetical protein [Nitrospira sp. WS110]